MWFVIVGLLIIAANLMGIGPMGNWTWNLTGDLWKFCVPFVFAAIWWAIADASGLNKRREIEKMEDKKHARRQENLKALGLETRARRKGK
ncbi:MAG TPA: TIGR04438 family Trp-rich protein [Sphingomicrobium sp.]|nr:TIGR04438 family Trp-rich protein [Sphingomicrobium sp.]